MKNPDFIKRKWRSGKSRWQVSYLLELSPLLLGFSLLALHATSGNPVFLTYSGLLCIFFIGLIGFLFASLGIKLGFFLHLELDVEFDFSLMIMYLLYVGLTITLLITRI